MIKVGRWVCLVLLGSAAVQLSEEPEKPTNKRKCFIVIEISITLKVSKKLSVELTGVSLHFPQVQHLVSVHQRLQVQDVLQRDHVNCFVWLQSHLSLMPLVFFFSCSTTLSPAARDSVSEDHVLVASEL